MKPSDGPWRFPRPPADTKGVTLNDDQVETIATAFGIEGEGDELRAEVEERLRLLVSDLRLLRTDEAAQRLGVPRARLARWAWRGEIPSVKLSATRNGWRYFEPHVIEELRRGGQKALARFSDNHKEEGVAA